MATHPMPGHLPDTNNLPHHEVNDGDPDAFAAVAACAHLHQHRGAPAHFDLCVTRPITDLESICERRDSGEVVGGRCVVRVGYRDGTDAPKQRVQVPTEHLLEVANEFGCEWLVCRHASHTM